MKTWFALVVMLFVWGPINLSWGQALEMAAQCDKARKQLGELIAT